MEKFIIDGIEVGTVDGDVCTVTNVEIAEATMISIRDEKLAAAVKPVIDWLYEYGNPYVRVEIDMAETKVYESFMHSLENEIRD